jgi:predicted MFS family arabinose efflux permease
MDHENVTVVDATLAAPIAPDGSHIAPARIFLFAAACGVIAAGSYLAQPLTAVIGRDVGLPPVTAGLIVTVSQLGYVLSLLLIAPLADIVETRRILFALVAMSVASLIGASLAPSGGLFLLACFGIGVSSVAVQMLVTLAAFLSPPERRGQVVGNVTSGLLVGIVLAWPVASFISGRLGWRGVFACDAAGVALLAGLLLRTVPHRAPALGLRYGALIGSLWSVFRSAPELRRRALLQAMIFGAASLFWTAVPLELQRRYGLSANGLAIFGLVDGVGALIAPVVGRLADGGRGRLLSIAGLASISLAFVVGALTPRVWLLCLVGIAIDAGLQANHVVSQRAVLLIRSDWSSRLNSLYVAIFFVGGAIGSAASAPLALASFSSVCIVGGLLGATALLIAARWLSSSGSSAERAISADAATAASLYADL